MTNYREIGSSVSSMWNGKDIKEGDELEGRYIGKNEDVGPNKSNTYNIETEDGTVKGVWGSTVIDGKFEEIAIGKMVKLIYNGKKIGKNGKEFKSFQIFVGIDRIGDEDNSDGSPFD